MTTPRIRFAWLVPTYRCNKRCSFCYNGEALLASRIHADTDTAERMISTLRGLPLEHCTILGGEPLIYPHLRHLLAGAASTGAKLSIVTNGVLFATHPDRVAWLADQNLNSLMVSLEPPQPASVGKQGLPGEHSNGGDPLASLPAHRVIAAMSDFPELPVRYVIKLFRDTVESVPRLIEKISHTCHKRVLISFGTTVIPDGGFNADYLLDPRELANWYVTLEDYCQSLGIAPSFYMNLPLCLFPADFLTRVVPDSRATFGCSLLRGDSIVLDYEGKVAQCTHFMPLSGDKIFDTDGLSADQAITDYWTNGEAARTADQLAVARHEACLDCPSFQKSCWGGCPILWSHYNPDNFISRPTITAAELDPVVPERA